MKIIVFDVGRGFCAFVKTPNWYSVLIDCGRKEKFSPLLHLFNYELPTCIKYKGKPIALFIPTHPHSDHLDELWRLKYSTYKPAVVSRRKDLNWARVLKSNFEFNRDVIEEYKTFLIDQYPLDLEDADLPNWGDGMTLTQHSLPETAVATISTSDTAYVNNSSVVVIVTYKGHKIVFGGDLHTEGWLELLKYSSFRSAIAGTTILVASHHGHKSGFCPDLYKCMGNPILHIVSERPERAGEDLVYGAYSFPNYSQGISYEGRTRHMFSTRDSGSVIIEILPNGKWQLDEEKFPDNEQ